MDGDIKAVDKHDAAAPPPENVRSRVSVWLSGIVDEVRRKSPVRLQKWTESSEINQSSNVHNIANTSKDSPETNEDLSFKPVLSEPIEIVPSNLEGISNPPKVWITGSLLSKVRGFEGLHNDQDPNRLSVNSIRSLGRVKINEFYDRVRINKARFNNLKSRKTMDIIGLNISESDSSELHIDDGMDEVLSSTRNSFNNTKDDSSLNDNLEISESDELLFHSNRKPPLGVIGRSNTSGGYGTNTNPVQTYQARQPPKSPLLANLKQKNLLGNIGRSFSEQTDDESDSGFILNERSRSYSHHVVSERQAIPNSTTDSDNNNVSSSLPTFFGRKSVPVSPVPQHKGAISREASLSDSSRQKSLLRDSSFQSDSSHCSSVESLLEARRPDPEAILVNLGFGPLQSDDVLSKIPKRFLKPSQVKGIDIDTFLRQQQMASHLHDHSVLGYRGLLGNPDIPPSLIVAKIMERFERNERNRCIMDIHLNRPQSAPPTPGPNQ